MGIPKPRIPHFRHAKVYPYIFNHSNFEYSVFNDLEVGKLTWKEKEKAVNILPLEAK